MIAICLLVAGLDGLDVPILGLIVPSLAREWGIHPSDFAAPSALGLIGMGLGTALLGALGDRRDPRSVLAACSILFGVATAATVLANGIAQLAVLRFVAGLGLGGALPNALSLIARHAPDQRRVFWLASVGTAMQAGGVVAGLLASLVIPQAGWRSLILIGGALPVAMCVPILLFIPRRGAILRGRTAFHGDGRAVVRAAPTWWALLVRGERAGTILLWSSFAVLYLGLYLIPIWLPSILAGAGASPSIASLSLAAFNVAGIFGGVAIGLLISRMGIRRPLIAVSALGAGWALLLVSVVVRSTPPGTTTLLLISAQGFLAVATMSALVALASERYPPRMRGTGVGAALAAARVGAVGASVAGAWIVSANSPTTFFGVVGGCLGVCALLCAAIPQPRRGYESSIVGLRLGAERNL